MIRLRWNRLYFSALSLTFLLAIPAVAFPAGPVEQKPCADEIEKFCGDVRPGEGSIVKCLREHDRELSSVCRDKVKIALERLEDAKQACAKDIGKFCADVRPGGGRMAKCLKQHLNEIAPACREKLGPIKARCVGGKKTVR
jgi:hypothetical protein